MVLLSDSLADPLSSLQLIERRLLIAGVIGLLFAIVAGYALATMHARRIRRLERAAERIAGGAFDEPVVDTGHDELGELAAAFERMRVRLEMLDRARREFIANASHELRTPLFSLGGFLELMADEELDEATRQEFLETMREQVDRLAKLATDLLDLSRLDAGRMRVEHEPVDLGTVAQLVAEEFGAVAERRTIVLEVVVDGRPIARADELRVLQVGRALVDNALVHTPPGSKVTLRAYADREHAYLEVEDDGPGVPAEHVPHVFDRFYRAEGGVASGSGLGLAIARELATFMDGEVELESEPGRTVVTGRARRRADVGGGPTRAASAFPRENARRYTVPMRPAALAVVALVAAALGATAVLLVGSLDRLDRRGRRRAAPSSSRRRRPRPARSRRSRPCSETASIRRRSTPAARAASSRSTPFFSSGQRSQGSGFVVSDEGHVLTNSHVVTDAGEGKAVHGASRVYVVFADGDRIPGEIVGWDLFNDIGVVKVDPRDHAVAPVPLGDSSRVVVGEPVAAIGSPFGQESSLVGRRRLGDRALDPVADLGLRRLRRDPDRRADQPRQLGRPAARRPRPGDRDQRPDPLRLRQRGGRRVRDSDQLRAPLDGAADQHRQGGLRLRRRHDPGCHSGRRPPLRPRRSARRADPVGRRRRARRMRAGLHGGSDLEPFNGISISLGGDLIVSFAGERVERAADIAAIVTNRLRPGQTVSVTVVRGGTGKRETVRLRLIERPLNPNCS